MSLSAPSGSGLQHDAFFYDDEEALFASAVPFVREGVESGDVVLVNTGEHPVTGLLKAVFADEEQVVFSDSSAYVKPVRAIDEYKRTMDRGLAAGVPGFRAIGTIDFDNTALPWTEWVHYEAAVNRVFANYPFKTMCLYDTHAVAPEIVTALRQAHPAVIEGGGGVKNPEYVEPAELLTEPELAQRLEPLRDGPAQLELDEVADLRHLRIDLYPATIFTGLPRATVDDFVKAVSEVVANACTHGEGPVRVRLWTTADRLVCTVTDQGPGIDDPLQGYARSIGSATTPSLSTHEGLGLWAARQLCDILDYERTDDGFTVRLVAFAD